MKPRILDCTLRDGGYYNNWNFKKEFVQKYLDTINKYVSIVELGLRLLNSDNYKGPLAFTKDKWLDQLNLPNNIQYAVMLNASDFRNSKNIKSDIDLLFPINAEQSKISLVRIAARSSDFKFISEIINCLKLKGFDVAINLMQISEFSDEDLIDICNKVSSLEPSIFYIADSLGSLRPNNIKSIFEVITKNINTPLGLHAHDNLGFARQNSLEAIKCGAKYIDSTLLGMGRGAGNAKTEEMIIELFYKKNDEYYLINLFDFLHNNMRQLKIEYGWGSDYLYMLSAIHKIHPSIVQYLIKDTRYSMSEIINIFNFLKNIDAKNISYSQLEEIEVISYSNLNKNNNNKKFSQFKLPSFDNILLVGSGPSALEYSEDLKNFADEKNCLLVTLNYLSPFTRQDFHLRAACNPIRFFADKDYYLQSNEILLLPEKLIDTINENNFEKSLKIICYNIEISSQGFEYTDKSCTLPNTLSIFYALSFLLTLKKDKIFLAGIDGYSKGDPRNEVIDDLFDQISQKSESSLIGLTPTIHKNIRHDSVFNF